MPLVSVIIPTYNTGQYINQAIESALAQTLQDIEVIVIDDGSTDETMQIAEHWTDSRIRYFRQEHSERSSARNKGIVQSKGDYIAFLDADDWWHPNKLEKQVSLFENNAELGSVYCWLLQVGPSGERLRIIKGCSDPQEATGAWIFQKLVMGNVPGPGSSMLVSRRCIEEVGGFRTNFCYGEDWEFCLRVASRYQVGFVPETLVFYRAHNTFMPLKMNRLNMQSASLEIVESAFRFAGFPFDSPLGRKARAKALYHGALVDVGVGSYESANERLAQAMSLEPVVFLGSTPPFVQFVAYFANYLYDTVTPLDEALFFTRCFFSNLDGTVSQLRRFQRLSLGWVCAVHAFEAKSLYAPELIRRSAWRAIFYDPRWLINGGLLSIGLRALLAHEGNRLVRGR